ncbi:MAG: ribosome silencing factor [Deltaproteobacteria bacterium]|nr:ribosome silencing factor [Deltaproteobacteria bacterium]
MPENAQEKSQRVAGQIAAIAAQVKAEEIRILDLRGLTSFTDFFVICTGRSNRQVQAIADAMYRDIRAKGTTPLGMEGYDTAQWILIDLGDVVAHIFYPEARVYYQIEKMWADAPEIPYAEAS